MVFRYTLKMMINDINSSRYIQENRKKCIINILKKQIPQNIKVGEDDLNRCPTCHNNVLTGHKYCSNCGQRIKFENGVLPL